MKKQETQTTATTRKLLTLFLWLLVTTTAFAQTSQTAGTGPRTTLTAAQMQELQAAQTTEAAQIQQLNAAMSNAVAQAAQQTRARSSTARPAQTMPSLATAQPNAAP
jgi:hypothetical protein